MLRKSVAENFLRVVQMPIHWVVLNRHGGHKSACLKYPAQQLRTIDANALDASVMVIRCSDPSCSLSQYLKALGGCCHVTLSGAGT